MPRFKGVRRIAASSPPVKTGNPIIIGTAQVGQTLTAAHGTYSGIVTNYSGQWYSGASAITGATSLSYTIASGDVGNTITYQESASNTAGSSATGTSNGLGPVTAASNVTYNTTIGNGVDSNGFADLPLRPTTARRFYVNNTHGSASDSNAGTSPSAPLMTVGHAMSLITDSAGDQVLIAQGTTYAETLPDLNGKRGFSTLYPTVIQSYDPADPTNEAKIGRAGSGVRPVLTGGSSTTSGGGAAPSQPASYQVFRGISFSPSTGSSTGGLGLTILSATGYRNGPFLFENCIFNAYGLVYQQEDQIGSMGLGRALIIRNCAFYGQWGYSVSGGYFSAIDHITIEDSVFWHNGWKVGVSRDTDVNSGGVSGANGRNHAFYCQEDCGSLAIRRNLFADSSFDGGQTRSSCVIYQNVYIDMPIAGALGSGAAYSTTKPYGVDLDYAYNFAIGDADAYSTYPLRWGIISVNGRPSSTARYNIQARSNDLTSTNATAFSTDALAAIPSYMTYRNNIEYLRIGAGGHVHVDTASNGIYTAQIHTTYNNNIWDDPASGTNLNVSSYSPTNAYTQAAMYSALGYADKTALVNYAIANPEQHVQRSVWNLVWPGYNGHTPALEDLATTINVTSGLAEHSIFVGTTDGSTLSAIGAPSWLTINNDTRSWTYDGTPQASASSSFTIRETLSGTSHDTVINYTVNVPPALSSASLSGITSSAVTINISTDTANGALHYIVDTHPTWWDGRRFDIRDGYSTDGAYSFAVKYGPQTVTATGAQSISVTGLTTATTYVVYVVHVNAAGWCSAASYLGSFTTL